MKKPVPDDLGMTPEEHEAEKCDTLIYVVPPENRKEVVPPMAKGEPEFRFKWQHIVFIVVALAFLAFVLFWICMLYAVTSWE
jgi:hypothetical protein